MLLPCNSRQKAGSLKGTVLTAGEVQRRSLSLSRRPSEGADATFLKVNGAAGISSLGRTLGYVPQECYSGRLLETLDGRRTGGLDRPRLRGDKNLMYF